MSVIRIKHQKDYVVIHKEALENPKLSFKAKGLWAYCMSRPDDWKFHVNHLASVSKDGEDAIYSAIKELIDEGYCEKKQGHNGRFETVEYVIYEVPIKINFTLREKQHAEKQLPENPPLLSTKEPLSIKEQPILLPPKPKAPESHKPTTKEDWRRIFLDKCSEEVFDRAWNKYLNAPSGSIKVPRLWLDTVINNELIAEQQESNLVSLADKHRDEARDRERQWEQGKGCKPVACSDRVEFVYGCHVQIVPYACSDEQWYSETRWVVNV